MNLHNYHIKLVDINYDNHKYVVPRIKFDDNSLHYLGLFLNEIILLQNKITLLGLNNLIFHLDKYQQIESQTEKRSYLEKFEKEIWNANELWINCQERLDFDTDLVTLVQGSDSTCIIVVMSISTSKIILNYQWTKIDTPILFDLNDFIKILKLWKNEIGVLTNDKKIYLYSPEMFPIYIHKYLPFPSLL